MMNAPLREEIMPGVHLTCLETSKFKTSMMSAAFIRPLSGEEASLNTLLPMVMLRGTKTYPDMALLSAAMDELYGADFFEASGKRDENQLTGLTALTIDDRYASGEPVTAEAARLLGELLLEPAMENGLFREDYVQGEKLNLLDAIAGQINDKRRYSLQRLIEEMCCGEPYAISHLGKEAQAQAINPQSLTDHYKKLLETSPLQLYFCGSKSFDEVKDIFLDAFKALPRGHIIPPAPVTVKKARGVKTVFESMDVAQGKLAMGWRLDKDFGYGVTAMLNAIFGGGMTSKLFVNVREKMSLCYHIASSAAQKKQLLIASAGIEFDAFEKTRDAIIGQLAACAGGDISDEEIDHARSALLSALKSCEDAQGRLEAFYSGQLITGDYCTPAQRAAEVAAVTREQIIQCARSAELDTIYFLRGA